MDRGFMEFVSSILSSQWILARSHFIKSLPYQPIPSPVSANSVKKAKTNKTCKKKLGCLFKQPVTNNPFPCNLLHSYNHTEIGSE